MKKLWRPCAGKACSVSNDTSATLGGSRGWKEICSAVMDGRVPQSVAAVVPAALQQCFAERYGRLLLGDAGWNEGSHPDLVNAGKYLTPPSIDECRLLPGALALHPITSDKRLAVIWAADKLSIEASNSLLKLTEEPPGYGFILFVAAEDKLIPTIKSRVWPVYIDVPEELVKPRRHPVSPPEWAAWIENGRKSGAEMLFLEIESWIMELTDNGDFEKAAGLETLLRVMGQKRLSVPMIQDLTFAVLKEGIPCEQIFSNIW